MLVGNNVSHTSYVRCSTLVVLLRIVLVLYSIVLISDLDRPIAEQLSCTSCKSGQFILRLKVKPHVNVYTVYRSHEMTFIP
jgi:hypothetical protein